MLRKNEMPRVSREMVQNKREIDLDRYAGTELENMSNVHALVNPEYLDSRVSIMIFTGFYSLLDDSGDIEMPVQGSWLRAHQDFSYTILNTELESGKIIEEAGDFGVIGYIKKMRKKLVGDDAALDGENPHYFNYVNGIANINATTPDKSKINPDKWYIFMLPGLIIYRAVEFDIGCD